MRVIIKNLIIRFRSMGVVVLVGFIVIIYIAFGFIYWQQGSRQGELEEQIAKLSLIISRPLPSREEMLAEYDEVNQALAPLTDSEAIAILVSIAEKSGIDTSEDSGKFRVPSATLREVVVGGGKYQVLSFSNIQVQGAYENGMAFVSDLDSGETLETMVLKRVTTSVAAATDDMGSEESVFTVDVDIYTRPEE